jgi:hypothetical protein
MTKSHLFKMAFLILLKVKEIWQINFNPLEFLIPDTVD